MNGRGGDGGGARSGGTGDQPTSRPRPIGWCGTRGQNRRRQCVSGGVPGILMVARTEVGPRWVGTESPLTRREPTRVSSGSGRGVGA